MKGVSARMARYGAKIAGEDACVVGSEHINQKRLSQKRDGVGESLNFRFRIMVGAFRTFVMGLNPLSP